MDEIKARGLADSLATAVRQAERQRGEANATSPAPTCPAGARDPNRTVLILGAEDEHAPADPNHPVPRCAERLRGLAIGDADRCMDLLARIQGLYGHCPTGRWAARQRREALADRAFAARLAAHRRDARARSLWQQAEAYRKAGLDGKAAGLYETIWNDHHGHTLADRARRRLLQMGRPVPQDR